MHRSSVSCPCEGFAGESRCEAKLDFAYAKNFLKKFLVIVLDYAALQKIY